MPPEELTRTELRRIAEEFKSERDAAKRDAMRAFDERNVLLARIADLQRQIESLWNDLDEVQYRRDD